MKDYRSIDILNGIKRKTDFQALFNSGIDPNQLKKAIIDLFDPYFTNKKILEESAIELLVADAVSLELLKSTGFGLQLFLYSLEIHKTANLNNKKDCLNAIIYWVIPIYKGITKYWSQFHLEIDKSELQDEEFLHENLRNFGSLLEGLTKPLCCELLHHQKISEGKDIEADQISNLKFGDVIDQLHSRCPDQTFFAPFDVRLSQWRNISQHISARLEHGRFVCEYGLPKKEIILTRDELFSLSKIIYSITSALRLAFDIFSLDNLNELNDEGLSKLSILLREETFFLNFFIGLNSQGFNVLSFESTKELSRITIQDMTDIDPNQRRIHTSQFVDLLWQYTKSKKVIVEYMQKDGKLNFRTSATEDIFEKIVDENLPRYHLAQLVEMVDLINDVEIPKNLL